MLQNTYKSYQMVVGKMHTVWVTPLIPSFAILKDTISSLYLIVFCLDFILLANEGCWTVLDRLHSSWILFLGSAAILSCKNMHMKSQELLHMSFECLSSVLGQAQMRYCSSILIFDGFVEEINWAFDKASVHRFESSRMHGLNLEWNIILKHPCLYHMTLGFVILYRAPLSILVG